MSEDLSQAVSIEEPLPSNDPEPGAEAATVDDDAEPEGVVEVTPGRRMVDVSVVAAERKRARESAEKRVREKELTPLQEKASRADQLEQALNAARPYVDLVRQHPELLQQQAPTTWEDQVSDDEAAQEARDLQLYDTQSQLDLKTARKIIARRRSEAYQAGQQAAQEVMGPLQQSTAEAASRENFARMAGARDVNGNPLVDPRILAQEWVNIPVELTQNPQVAEVVLERAIGKSHRQGLRVAPARRDPVFSEQSGGRRPATSSVPTDLDRKLGLTEKDLKEASKGFVPGGISVIGD